MGKVKDKLIQLEEEGVIVWSDKLNSYMSRVDRVDPVPFDLAQYLFDLHRKQADEE